MTTPYDVILGLDVGKTAHHGCALDAAGAKLYDKELPQDETALREVIGQLQDHGSVWSWISPTLSVPDPDRRSSGLRCHGGVFARLGDAQSR